MSQENEPRVAKMTQRNPRPGTSAVSDPWFGAAQLRGLGSVLLRKLLLSCEKVRQLKACEIGKEKAV